MRIAVVGAVNGVWFCLLFGLVVVDTSTHGLTHDEFPHRGPFLIFFAPRNDGGVSQSYGTHENRAPRIASGTRFPPPFNHEQRVIQYRDPLA